MDKNNSSDENNSSRPVTPSNDECCGNSCTPCIFDVHKKLLDQWEKRKNQGIKGERIKNALSPLSYKKFEVTKIGEVADEFIKINLCYRRDIEKDSCVFLHPGQHVILCMNKRSRPYTPISWTNNSIELLVKVYPTGAFSRDLKQLKIGETIQVRGPYGDFVYKKNSFRQIVAFCIGSGIAAIYPVTKSIVDDEIEETKIHIFAGFRTMSHVPLIKELRLLSDYWNVKCTLQLSNTISHENVPTGLEIRRGRFTANIVGEILESHSPDTTLVLICGTQEFNKFLEDWLNEHSYRNYHVFS